MSAGPAIKIGCVHCATRLKVEPRYIGRTIKCPKCGKPFQAVTEAIAIIDDDPRDGEDKPARSLRKPSSKRQKLRQIALYQRGVNICLLIYLVLIAAQFTVEPGMRPLIFGPIALLDGLVGSVFVFLLSIKVYSTAIGVILGIIALVPCIGLIVLLVINFKATSVLRQNGIHVGLLGASVAD